MLKKREKATIQRIDNTQRAAAILRAFIKLGFNSVPTVLAIATHYYPETTRTEVLAFWHFRNVNTMLVDKMDNVLEKLKAE